MKHTLVLGILRLYLDKTRLLRPARLPAAVSSPPAALAAEVDPQLHADRDSLQQIVMEFNRLEQRLNDASAWQAPQARGYFTPDEDDRLRQMLLSYRSYRLTLYEIIRRYQHYSEVPDAVRQLRGFLVGFAAALTLYAKSLKLIQSFERAPLVRAKLNEPDAKFGLDADFFDDVLGAFSSLGNYQLLVKANWFWRRQQKTIQRLRLVEAPEWRWLTDVIRQQRMVVRQRLAHVLSCRLRHDWRMFWQTTVRPVRRTRYNFQSFVGSTVAGIRTTTRYQPAISENVLGQLRSQLRPGDVLLMRAEQKLTSAVLPGFWAHAAIYLGEPRDLEALGLCTHPHVQKHWPHILEGEGPDGQVIEAIRPRTKLSPLEKSLHADHVVVLRPNLVTQDVAAALAEAFGHLGKPYDFEFDFNVSSRIVCTELIYRSFHHRWTIEFPLIKRLGRYTLSCDDIIDHFLSTGTTTANSKPPSFHLIALVLKGADEKAHFISNEKALEKLREIRDGWRPNRN